MIEALSTFAGKCRILVSMVGFLLFTSIGVAVHSFRNYFVHYISASLHQSHSIVRYDTRGKEEAFTTISSAHDQLLPPSNNAVLDVTKIPTTLEELTEQLNLQKERKGKYKSFYPSNRSQEVGWLVAYNQPFPHYKPFMTVYEAMVVGYEIARHALNKYNLLHLFLGPPVLFPDQNGAGLSRLEMTLNLPDVFNQSHSGIVAQPCRFAPSNHTFVKCTKNMSSSYSMVKEKIESFVLAKVPNITQFAINFERDIHSTKQLLEFHPGLNYDFQFGLDSTGRLWHLDLERMFQSKQRHEKKMQKNVVPQFLSSMVKVVKSLVAQKPTLSLEVDNLTRKL